MFFDSKIQAYDVTVTIALLLLGCVAGNYVMKHVVDTWFAWGGPILGIFLVGGSIWFTIRSKLIKKWDETEL